MFKAGAGNSVCMPEQDRRLIETGIDRLMDYLEEEKAVAVSEAADSLGADEETVLTWAESLEDAGLLTITFSARKGKILRPAPQLTNTEEQEDAVREQADDKIEQAKQWNREKARIDRFEDALNRLQELLNEDERNAKQLKKELGAVDAEGFEQYDADVAAAEDDIADLKQRLDALKQDIDTLAQLEERRKKEKTAENKTETRSRWSWLPFVGGKTKTETFKCEQCERVFDTEKGLKTHIGMVHKDDG